jgi:ribose 1,5-bisphosphokinase
MTQGRLIAVVGPSGVGKDSVMRALAGIEPRLDIARRCITRPPDNGSEDFDSVTVTRFEALRADGAFALNWGAHGLFYGIPHSALNGLVDGRDVLANLSRGALPDAAARAARLHVLSLDAAPEVLAARLHRRGRESAKAIGARLARSGAPVPPGVPVTRLWNDGALSDTVAQARAALYPASG